MSGPWTEADRVLRQCKRWYLRTRAVIVSQHAIKPHVPMVNRTRRAVCATNSARDAKDTSSVRCTGSAYDWRASTNCCAD